MIDLILVLIILLLIFSDKFRGYVINNIKTYLQQIKDNFLKDK